MPTWCMWWRRLTWTMSEIRCLRACSNRHCSTYQRLGMPTVITLRVLQQGQNGLIYLSVSVHGHWVYAFSVKQLGQWRQSVKGASSTLALAYLNAQAGVAAVRIQLPFGSDHLPASIDQIKIVLVT